MNHTPGPWEIRQYTNYYGYSIDAEGRGCIAERWYDFPQQETYGSEIPANALLIAAAPDLLAVAKAYEAWEADLILNGDWSGACVKMTQEQHDRMIELQTMRNAAITKATHI